MAGEKVLVNLIICLVSWHSIIVYSGAIGPVYPPPNVPKPPPPNVPKPPPPNVPKPPPPNVPKPPPPPPAIVAKVTGIVYCFECYNWKNPSKSTKSTPLSGAKVEVTCTAKGIVFKAQGSTKSDGKYRFTIKGYDYKKYGKKSCVAKLVKCPSKSICNTATNYHNGLSGARLSVLSKSTKQVLLTADSLACAPKTAPSTCK